eukprot:1029970-Prorocentrum_minimum.AAC.1
MAGCRLTLSDPLHGPIWGEPKSSIDPIRPPLRAHLRRSKVGDGAAAEVVQQWRQAVGQYHRRGPEVCGMQSAQPASAAHLQYPLPGHQRGVRH